MDIIAFTNRYFRPLIAVFALIILLALALIFLPPLAQKLQQGSYLEIAVAPSTATVEIAGQTLKKGVSKLDPGTYTAKISAPNFSARSETVTIKPHETTTLLAFLEPPEGLKYYEDYPGDIDVLRRIDTPELKDFLKNYDQKMSIRNKLPMSATYNLNANHPENGNHLVFIELKDGTNMPTCTKSFCLLVESRKQETAVVEQFLHKNGYNINDYQVIYQKSDF